MHDAFPTLLVKSILEPDARDAAAENGNKLVEYWDTLMQNIDCYLRVEAKFDDSMAIRCGFKLDFRNLPSLLDFGKISQSRSGFPAV